MYKKLKKIWPVFGVKKAPEKYYINELHAIFRIDIERASFDANLKSKESLLYIM
jgi:hypothetical protein